MQLIGLKSEIVGLNDDLLTKILASLNSAAQTLKDGDVLVVSSKVVALAQGRVAKLANRDDKSELRELVKQESDYFIPGEIVDFTLKYNIIIPNAGIDKSNAADDLVILWPENPQAYTDQLRQSLMQKFALKKLGVILNDSRCQPLRQGVSGISLTYSGIIGVEDRRGEPDLFGRELKITKEAKADALAVAANLVMGEGNEAIPFVIARNAPVRFTDEPQDSIALQYIAPEDCIFGTIFQFDGMNNKAV
ncbi:coenzyme F420-0:L-glutamate ligase [Candidatus Gracilibacteria bacterium]|nr:coenzyme F420-0:L-glutamate ligase [Candidatus Gracilibacteria bacterium]